jgi:hypothetical protein
MNGMDVSHVSRIDEIITLSLTINYTDGQEIISMAELVRNGQVTFEPPLSQMS